MNRKIKNSIRENIENDFEKRISSLGKIGIEIRNKSKEDFVKNYCLSEVELDKKTANEEKTFAAEEKSDIDNVIIFFKAFIAYLPLGDIAAYSSEMFLEYALHADFLYRNSPYSINLSDECFLNYVATPRINTEDLTSCRKFFYEQVRERICKMDLKDAAIEINNWCYEHATYHSTSERTASPITVYKCGYGRCGEESTFYTTVLRSVGIPSRQVYVPRWSHSDSNHAWVEVFDGNKWLFTGACEPKPVFQNGWFSYATSRAMLVHSRCFTPFYVEKDEVIGNEGIVRISSSSSNYLKQKEIEFRVLDTDGEPVIGANVEFEIINSSELYPIIKTKTNKNGIATAKLGLGTVFARAYCMKKGSLFEKEMVFDVSTLENKNIESDGLWKHIYFNAPSSDDVHGIVLTKALEEEQNKRNFAADTIRNDLHKCSKLQKEYLEKYSEYPQIKRAIRKSYLNFDQIKIFLDYTDGCTNIKNKERLLKTLSQKDLRDVNAKILLDHMKAFEMEESVEICEDLGSKGPFVDAENHADSNDYDAEFYRASDNDFFAEYVASPRIYIEHLTSFRSEIKEILGDKCPFLCAGEIWKYITDNISVTIDEEYDSLITTPASLLKLGRGSQMSREVLFVAICRTYGIPACIDNGYRKAGYFNKDGFVYADEKLKKSATIELVSDNGMLPLYFDNYTICYKKEDGNVITLENEEFFLRDCNRIKVALIPGSYRIINCKRMPSGSLDSYLMDFDLRDGDQKQIVLNQIKRNQSDMISYRYHLSIADAGSPVIFIKPGEEPTEHVLHELIELQAVGRKFKHKPVLVFAKPYNEGDMNLKKVLDFDDWDIETVEDYDGKVLRDILTDREDVLNYPYVFYVRSENEINFIGNGYSVGIIDNLYETQDAVE